MELPAAEGKLPKLGTFTLKSKTLGTGLGGDERVDITFRPDAESPVMDHIGFVQSAHTPGSVDRASEKSSTRTRRRNPSRPRLAATAYTKRDNAKLAP
jgi:hypothetical protein